MRKNNKNLIKIVKMLYAKIIKMNIVSFFILLFKIRSNINLILKFILLFILLIANTNEFTSICDLGDLVLKMVEQEDNNDVKVDNNILQTEEQKENVDFDSMELGEWLDYLREHEPKAYWFWILAFGATSVFCIWLMHYLIGPGFPPKEPY